MLIELGEAAVPVILKMMQDKRWYIVRNLSAILGGHRYAGSAARVADVCTASRYTCQQGGHPQFGKDRRLERLKRLSLLFFMAKIPRSFPRAIASLGGMKSRKALAELIRIVCGNDLFLNNLPLKIDALNAIAVIGDRQAVPVLTKLLVSRHIFRP